MTTWTDTLRRVRLLIESWLKENPLWNQDGAFGPYGTFIYSHTTHTGQTGFLIHESVLDQPRSSTHDPFLGVVWARPNEQCAIGIDLFTPDPSFPLSSRSSFSTLSHAFGSRSATTCQARHQRKQKDRCRPLSFGSARSDIAVTATRSHDFKVQTFLRHFSLTARTRRYSSARLGRPPPGIRVRDR